MRTARASPPICRGWPNRSARTSWPPAWCPSTDLGQFIWRPNRSRTLCMADGASKSATMKQKFGEGFLADTWYFAALSGDLKRGKLQRYEILGEPVLLGRDNGGRVYALRDVCPHRAAPL